MYLEDYLKKQHLDYCISENEMISESDWVNDVLNKGLPRDDRLSYPSVNQWMNGGRSPDSNNISRLIEVFGPEVMPVLGINITGILGDIINAWDSLPEEVQLEIQEKVKKYKKGYVNLQA